MELKIGYKQTAKILGRMLEIEQKISKDGKDETLVKIVIGNNGIMELYLGLQEYFKEPVNAERLFDFKIEKKNDSLSCDAQSASGGGQNEPTFS